jgi:hypothetical protein
MRAPEPYTRDIRVGLCGFTTSMRSYARDFPVVEVQSTFYDPPRDDTMRKWLATTGPTLEYTMKVWQLVTHPATSPTYRRMKRKVDARDAPGFFRDSPGVHEGWGRSLECATVLSATAMLFQCPASFTPIPENLRRMRRFFERIVPKSNATSTAVTSRWSPWTTMADLSRCRRWSHPPRREGRDLRRRSVERNCDWSSSNGRRHLAQRLASCRDGSGSSKTHKCTSTSRSTCRSMMIYGLAGPNPPGQLQVDLERSLFSHIGTLSTVELYSERLAVVVRNDA